MEKLGNEQVAERIVGIYFKEIARLGFKRTLGLDEVINAYYYALLRLQNKEGAMKDALQKVLKEEKQILAETKKDIAPILAEIKAATAATKETR